MRLDPGLHQTKGEGRISPTIQRDERVPQVKNSTWELVESEIYVLWWQPVDFTAKFTPFTNVIGEGLAPGLGL